MIADGVRVNSGAKVLIGSVVIRDVKHKEVVSGNFAFNHKSRLRRFIEGLG